MIHIRTARLGHAEAVTLGYADPLAPPSRDVAMIEVSDNGPGIPLDAMKKIFEPFFTTKAVGLGTGLGLDIAWRIVVNKHHGDLRVDSVPGDTRFQVYLPVTEPV